MQPYKTPFLTINAALATALPNQEVFIYPGTYNESITIPTGVSVRGANKLNTIIQQIDPIVTTSVVTMNQHTLLEDITINILLTSTSDPVGPYVGVTILTGASINSEINNCNINATLINGSTNLYGILSQGISNFILTSSNTLRNSSISVGATGTGNVRGIYVDGPNLFTMRSNLVFCSGTGSDLVGCEVNDISNVGTINIKASSISGVTSDILQTSGFIIIGGTDLLTHTAPLSFDVTIQPANIFFGIFGFPGGNLTYYLPPTIVPIASVSTTTPYNFTFIDPTIVFGLNISYSGTIVLGDSITFAIYKNGVLTSLQVTLTSVSGTIISLKNVGITFLSEDIIDARLILVGSPSVGQFTSSIVIY